MTEADWIACDDPLRMLTKVIRNGVPRRASDPGGKSDRASDRKLRLFACACHRLFHRPTSSFNDGYIKTEESDGTSDNWVMKPYALAHDWCVEAGAPKEFNNPQTKTNTANLLRDIIGNPFRPVLQLCSRHTIPDDCPGCQAIRTPTVLSLAQAAYDERRRQVRCTACSGEGCSGNSGCMEKPGQRCDGSGKKLVDEGTLDPIRLGVLSDALEEAGCDNEDVLGHLRSPGPHVRGCWVLDLLLGKE